MLLWNVFLVVCQLCCILRCCYSQTELPVENCSSPVTRDLRADQFSASSEYDAAHNASSGRYGNDGWIAGTKDMYQYLTVDLEGLWEITKLTFYDSDEGWYSRALRVSYSINGYVWTPYNTRLSDDAQGELFERRRKTTDVAFNPPLKARYITINPVSYYKNPSLLMELFGCMTSESPTAQVTNAGNSIDVDTTWIPNQSPIIVNNPIVVRPAATLTIQAGVSLIFTSDQAGIEVWGTFISDGIPGLRVLITSSDPVLSAYSQWRGITQKSGELQLTALKVDLKDTNKMAYAEGSRRNLKLQWESFMLFCIYFSQTYLPASTVTLQLYAQFLSRSLKSVDSIKNYISGVRTIHLMLGYSVDHLNAFLINLSLRGIAKSKLHMVKRAEPMTPEILEKIYKIMNFSCTDNLVYWCLFLFAFFLMTRKSNLVPTHTKDLIKPKFLLRKDVEISDGNLIVHMRWTKTIQTGERELLTPLTIIPDSILCPVKAFNQMVHKLPAPESSPLFILESGKAVSYDLFQLKLRSVIKDIGLEPKLFSTHSFRRGLATLAFRLDIPSDLIQLMGDWRSDAYKKYIEYSLTDKLKVSQFISQNINKPMK